MMKRFLTIIAALLFIGQAHAQGLSNLPPNTVIGRLGAGVPGPAQAIPLSNLFSTKAYSQSSVSAPTAAASTGAFQMQGLAGSIIPTTSGRVLIIISGTITSTSASAGVGLQWQISYGTGTAPTNGAALVGVQAGAIQEYLNPATVTAVDVQVPFSIQAIVVGLTANTPYWIDLAAKAISSASATPLTNVSISVVEI